MRGCCEMQNTMWFSRNQGSCVSFARGEGEVHSTRHRISARPRKLEQAPQGWWRGGNRKSGKETRFWFALLFARGRGELIRCEHALRERAARCDRDDASLPETSRILTLDVHVPAQGDGGSWQIPKIERVKGIRDKNFKKNNFQSHAFFATHGVHDLRSARAGPQSDDLPDGPLLGPPLRVRQSTL